jgi:hypothetical protein
VTDPAVADLREILELGLAHGGELLTAGELAVVRRIQGLQGEPASLYARLSARRPQVFHLPSLTVRRVDDLPGALAVLEGLELADGLVPWSLRARYMRRSELVLACRARGLPATGRKDDLVQRLAPHRDFLAGRWVRLRHRQLVRRLEQMAFLRPWPDRSVLTGRSGNQSFPACRPTALGSSASASRVGVSALVAAPRSDSFRSMLVLSRMGVVRWPEYALTSGAGAFRDRRALLAWERLLEGELSPEEVLEALASGTAVGGGGLDLRGWLVAGLREAAGQVERRGEPATAARWYQALVEGGHVRAGKVAVRWARTVEKQGQPVEALAIVRAAMPGALPSEQVALRRMGRRLARSLRTGFAPARPLQSPRVRQLRLVPASRAAGSRPRWEGPEGEALTVEAAVLRHLARAGRKGLHAEGTPFCTLVTALCAELYFLPVPGALPVRFLAGPLDLGTPQFRARRAEPLQQLLMAIDRGEAPELVARADERWRGTRLHGARWDVVDKDTLVELARGLGPAGTRTLVETLLEHGPGQAAGLPDLVVLPGERVRLELAWPGWVPQTLLLVEIKGPGDTVRDEQRVWHDRLLQARVPVELWEVASR